MLGGINITEPALKAMLRESIELSLLTSDGELIGHLTPASPRNMALRLAQYQRHSDSSARLTAARAVTVGKIEGCLAAIRAWRANGDVPGCSDAMIALAATAARASQAPDIERLRGYEGVAARKYFTILGKFLRGGFCLVWTTFPSCDGPG